MASASEINPRHPKAGSCPLSFRTDKATILWVLLLLIAFYPTVHGQILQDEPFTTPGLHYQLDSVCARKGVSSVLILREDNEQRPSLCYREYDRHGRILKRVDQIDFSYSTFQYPSQGTVLTMAYDPTKKLVYEGGWHLNFPKDFVPVFLYRTDVDEKGNWYRESAARMPIVADTNFEVKAERKISYGEDSIVTFETGFLGTCWNRRSVFDPDGKLRSQLLLPADGECHERVYCDSMVYKSAPHTWTIMRPSYYFPDYEVTVRDDGQPKKFVEISSEGKRELSQKNYFSQDGLLIKSTLYPVRHPYATETYTYNEKGLLSEIRYIDVAGRIITTRYQYAYF